MSWQPATLVGVFPGFIIGALLKALMYVFGGWAENSDFLYLHALFGVEAPGAIYNFIFAKAVPNGFQAVVGGFVAVWIMEKIARGANHALAATVTGALFTGFLICLVIVVFNPARYHERDAALDLSGRRIVGGTLERRYQLACSSERNRLVGPVFTAITATRKSEMS
jgi:hypothetical protein